MITLDIAFCLFVGLNSAHCHVEANYEVRHDAQKE